MELTIVFALGIAAFIALWFAGKYNNPTFGVMAGVLFISVGFLVLSGLTSSTITPGVSRLIASNCSAAGTNCSYEGNLTALEPQVTTLDYSLEFPYNGGVAALFFLLGLYAILASAVSQGDESGFGEV